MTKKRFVLKSNYDWWGVVDTTGEIKGKYRDCFSTDDVIDLLNALHEENQELIDALNQRTQQLDDYQQKVEKTLQKHYDTISKRYVTPINQRQGKTIGREVMGSQLALLSALAKELGVDLE